MSQLIKKLKHSFSKTINLIRVELIFGALFAQFYALLFSVLSDIVYSQFVVNIYSVVFFSTFLFSFLNLVSEKYLRITSNLLYFAANVFILFVAYDNNYNSAALFLVIMNYSLVNFSLPNLKIFALLNIVFYGLVISSFYLLEFNAETSLWLVILILSFLTLASFSIVFSREVYRKRLKDRELLLNHIFNNSPDGLILINKSNLVVLDCNAIALELLKVNKLDLLGKVIVQFRINKEYPFFSLDRNKKETIFIENYGIIYYQKKEINYVDKSYLLVQIKYFKNRENLTENFTF